MDYTAEIEEIKSEIFFVKEEISSLEDENKTLKLVYDYYSNKLGRKTVSTNFLKTNNTITIQGWCPVEDNEKLKEICNEQLKDDYYITFEDVKEEEIDDVPIKLSNHKLSRTFESVTEMYSSSFAKARDLMYMASAHWCVASTSLAYDNASSYFSA